MAAAAKVHKSALCVIPPAAATGAVQRVRHRLDKSYVRWPPHINLLYPFIEDAGDSFEEAAKAALSALSAIKPFKLRLGTLSFFSHGPRSHTLWLGPDEGSAAEQALCSLQAALQAAFPGCTDLSDDPSRGITHFTPHLSLGQRQDKQQLLQDIEGFNRQGLALEFDVREVCLISRQGYSDPFTIRWAVPLGTATPAAACAAPQRVDVPYVATVPQNLQQLLPATGPQDRARFGIGAWPGGTWNFAYGANMSPRKLGGSRGLQPLESRPAVLPAHRLSFTHRGGFGNVVAVDGLPSPSSAAGKGPAPDAVHGVLHRLTAAELAALTCMEHEYLPVEVLVQPYANQEQQQQQQQEQQQHSSPAGTAGEGAGASPEQPRAAAAAAAPEEQEQVPEQPPPVLAVAFMSPPERCISEGLPPIQRYLELLVDGARHWRLDPAYTAWLAGLPSIAQDARSDAHYTSPQGEALPAWPKIRTGSSQQGRRGGRGGGGRGGGKR